MYCVVRQYKMKSPEDIDKVIDGIRDAFLPIVSKERGFVGYSVALSEQGELITTGFFQDRAGADESTRLAADWVRDNMKSAVDGPPKVTEGDVRIQERRGGEATYGLLRRAKLQSGKMNEALDLMRGKMIPMLAEVPGFVSTALLEVGPDEFLTLGAWRDRASAQEATRRGMAFMQEHAAHLMAGPPEMIDGEIKLRHINEAVL